jgi:hypothetical protein
MKRWHLTLALTLLAAAGAAIVGGLPVVDAVVGAARPTPEPPLAPAPPTASTLTPAPAEQEPVPAVEVLATPPAPPTAPPPPRPVAAPPEGHDGVHPIHTDPGDAEPPPSIIPETRDRPRPHPIRALPPDPPVTSDYCPPCGRG